ncbi:DUF1446 domain-containing protein [soil metagenome]
MTERRAIRIGNSSGFYGDRVAAAWDMVNGGAIDVLTGDYLAELTLYILHKARLKNPEAGYATTFLTQMEQVLGTCLDRNIKIVANAGGLNPGGLTLRLRALCEKLGLSATIASVDGDDVLASLPGLQAAGHPLTHLDTGKTLSEAGITPVTANAYLGAWPIVAALEAGSDIVVTGRVTDASLVVGPAAWWHGWGRSDFDRLAGAVVAGHVIECGPQATGGNYSFLDEVTDLRHPGFPIAEVFADGSSVITKHPDTGGIVSTGTVTAQLLYEIQSPSYGGPDVTTWFNTIDVSQEAPDRVLISGTRGTPPTGDLKVAINFTGGYRNSMTMVLTGLDIETKAERAENMLFDLLGGKDTFDDVDVRLIRSDKADARSEVEAGAHLVVTVKDQDPSKVGRRFSNTVLELALGGYPGFHTLTPPSSESAYGVYWPTLIPADAVSPRVVFDDGSQTIVAPVEGDARASALDPVGSAAAVAANADNEPRALAPLGTFVGARSGDKGGNANIGLWTRTEAEYDWLRAELTVERLRELLPEIEGLPISRYELPNLNALNFIVVGILGEGVASSTRPDPQAKGLGEFTRSRLLEIPVRLLPGAVAARAAAPALQHDHG